MQTHDKAPPLLLAFRRTYWALRAARKIALDSLRTSLSCRNPRVFVQAMRLYREEGFEPKEAFRLGLLNGAGAGDHVCKFTSRKKLKRIQEAINPRAWECLTEDKGLFYRHCQSLGVPIPALYGIFFRDTAGWSHAGSIVTKPESWEKFFRTEVPSEFVIKPARGVYGRGLHIFTRRDGKFVDPFGASHTAADLYSIMASDVRYDSFLIQERLKNHPDILYLTGTEFLQSVRAITFVDKSGPCAILLAHLKLIVGQNLADNTQGGLTGNMQVLVSIEDGLLMQAAVVVGSNGSGLKSVPHHPRTGHSFQGFRVPLWPQVCRLVKEAALKFLPIRAIGWDVAVTPTGPVIVEGNMFWDPPNLHARMDVVLAGLAAGT